MIDTRPNIKVVDMQGIAAYSFSNPDALQFRQQVPIQTFTLQTGGNVRACIDPFTGQMLVSRQIDPASEMGIRIAWATP